MAEEARLLGGAKIDWNDPPASNARVQWSRKDEKGRAVTGSLRVICHLNRLNNLAVERFSEGVSVIQPPFTTTVDASAGTHDFDACMDIHIPGVDWWAQQRFFRANGLGCWYRHPPAFSNHIHGFALPPREGTVLSDDFAVIGRTVGFLVDGGVSSEGHVVASSQLTDYYNHAFGLKDQHTVNSDHSWFPADIEATIFDLDRYIARRAG
jgi:hypothetical protein